MARGDFPLFSTTLARFKEMHTIMESSDEEDLWHHDATVRHVVKSSEWKHVITYDSYDYIYSYFVYII